jgi:hypothetical protein
MSESTAGNSKIARSGQPARIFISYKRNVTPDEPVALEVFHALRTQHDVFIDQTIPVGTRWGARIADELRRADFLIALLSAESVHSEMVAAEIATAHHLAKTQDGRPAILPVRLAYGEPFQYPLNAYLDLRQGAFWQTMQDTPRLIAELRRALAGYRHAGSEPSTQDTPLRLSTPPSFPPPLPAAPLEMPSGSLDPHSVFYVERAEDRIALRMLEQKGVTIPIKGPRQMGKSSLLMRLIQAAINSGRQVAFLDFQLFDRTALYEADTFFRQFCAWLTEELDMENRVEDHWHRSGGGNILRCTRYVGRYLLPSLTHPLTLAMDEVESIFDTPFRSDFFSMLRSWHNYRATNPLWKQLDLLLVTSTEPYQLIADLNQSPFNVGEVIELTDFTPEQVHDLNRRHGSPFLPAEEQQLTELLHGQPYLVRRALYLVATQRLSVAELFTRASEDRGPFGDHLRYHLFRLHNNKHLIQGLQQVISAQTCADEDVFFRLHGAGLVRRVGRMVLPRCPLYAAYFGERLDG